MVPGNLAFAALGRERESNRKSCRYAGGTRITYEDGIEVNTVAAPLFADIIKIAAPRPFYTRVVFHRCSDMLVNRARHLDIRAGVRLLHHVAGPCANLGM